MALTKHPTKMKSLFSSQEESHAHCSQQLPELQEQVKPEERRIKRVFKRVFLPDSVFYDENNGRLEIPTHEKVSPQPSLVAPDQEHSQDDLESCAGTRQEPSCSWAAACREPNAAAPEAETGTEPGAASER